METKSQEKKDLRVWLVVCVVVTLPQKQYLGVVSMLEHSREKKKLNSIPYQTNRGVKYELCFSTTSFVFLFFSTRFVNYLSHTSSPTLHYFLVFHPRIHAILHYIPDTRPWELVASVPQRVTQLVIVMMLCENNIK